MVLIATDEPPGSLDQNAEGAFLGTFSLEKSLFLCLQLSQARC